MHKSVAAKLFENVNKTLTLKDLEGTRIPGVRKFIRYGIKNQIARSRVWLVICVVVALLLVYNSNHYWQIFWNQKKAVIRSFNFPTEVTYPSMIMCTPTTYSYVKLKRWPQLIPFVLNNLNSQSLYEKLVDQNFSRPMMNSEIIELLELNLNQTIISCQFQNLPCSFNMKLVRYSSHACFVIEGMQYMATSITGRDGGLSILLNLNSYQGVDERPSLSSGLKIIFLNPKYAELPDAHDTVYADSGRLNSISLIGKRYKSIGNCSNQGNDFGHLVMQREQVRYNDGSISTACVSYNYYTTKTGAKLRSDVIYQKLSRIYYSNLKANASLSNQLRSMHLPELRSTDTALVKEQLMLTMKLLGSFSNWSVPQCTRIRHKINSRVTVFHVRGKAQALRSYTVEHLNKFAKIYRLYMYLYRKRVAQLVSQYSQNTHGLGLRSPETMKPGSETIKILKNSAVEYHSFVTLENMLREEGERIIHNLGNVAIFAGATRDMVNNSAQTYFKMHNNFHYQMRTLISCWIANKRFIIKNVPFMHSYHRLCINCMNTSTIYGECPEEINCPDFHGDYMKKYDLPFLCTIDSSRGKLIDVDGAVFSYCAIGVRLKDIVRSHGLNFASSYAPWFELFRLNQIATIGTRHEEAIFDPHDVECRIFQACGRLTMHVGHYNDHQLIASDFWTGYNPVETSSLVLQKVGIIGYGLLQSCQQEQIQTLPFLARYLQAHHEAIIKPYESILTKLVNFRKLLELVRSYKAPDMIYESGSHSLIHQFKNHLTGYIKTGNFSELAFFLNRRGKIMIGQMRINVQNAQLFLDSNINVFSDIYWQSRKLNADLQQQANEFLRIIRLNVTASALSFNTTNALNIVQYTTQCSRKVLVAITFNTKDTLRRLNDWLVNIQSLNLRAKEYKKMETLDANFVRNNFVHVEIYFEHLSESIDSEIYPFSDAALISRLGSIGRFYMGLKIFNVAEFLGPIVLFLIYRVYLLFHNV